MARPPFKSKFAAGKTTGTVGSTPLPFPAFSLPLPGVGRIADLVTRTINANLQFQQAMGQLTLQFLQASAQVGINFVQQIAGAASDDLPFAPGVVPGGPSIFLEGAIGETPTGRFVVENTLPQAISSKIVSTVFRDDVGNTLSPILTFDPPSINLNPAEQAIVSVTASISGDMVPGVDYGGELEVEGMPGRITMIIRRRVATSA